MSIASSTLCPPTRSLEKNNPEDLPGNLSGSEEALQMASADRSFWKLQMMWNRVVCGEIKFVELLICTKIHTY